MTGTAKLVSHSRFSRKLRIYFFTSNPEKLLQARLLFQRVGLSLSHFRAIREPYEEDYGASKEVLLQKAIEQVRTEFLVRSIFFVEDTSIRLEAFSNDSDYPGLRAKEWFAETSFGELDRQLKEAGNDRRAAVKSDIALHLPNLEESFFFHGETAGYVADDEPSFQENSTFPWLTPHTFNGWFVPEDCTIPLGALPIEDSIDFDFRAKSILEMLRFLRPLNAAINLPSSFFYRDDRDRGYSYFQPYLPNIFERGEVASTQIICIIGHKCAGKTTASEFVTTSYGANFFEASEELRRVAKSLGVEIDSAEAAKEFLAAHGQAVVGNKILEKIDRGRRSLFVISGFRTVEELAAIYDEFPNTKTILVAADRRIRFERHIQRGRDQVVRTARDFKAMDHEQLDFGLLQVAEEIADYEILNDSDIDAFYEKIDNSVKDALLENLAPRGQAFGHLSEFHRCLFALDQLDKISTCEEIFERTSNLGGRVWRYNTNRALKDLPMFAERHDHGNELLSYEITPKGRTLLHLLNRTAGI